jgi:hypothetical protein
VAPAVLRGKHDPKELKDWTKRFAVNVIQLCRELPPTLDGRPPRRAADRFGQLGRRELARRVPRPLSRRVQRLAKLGNVLEESDESLFWLELMVDSNPVPVARAERPLKEADELTAIFTAAVKTAKG